MSKNKKKRSDLVLVNMAPEEKRDTLAKCFNSALTKPLSEMSFIELVRVYQVSDLFQKVVEPRKSAIRKKLLEIVSPIANYLQAINPEQATVGDDETVEDTTDEIKEYAEIVDEFGKTKSGNPWIIVDGAKITHQVRAGHDEINEEELILLLNEKGIPLTDAGVYKWKYDPEKLSKLLAEQRLAPSDLVGVKHSTEPVDVLTVNKTPWLKEIEQEAKRNVEQADVVAEESE